jgi:hypothetical protein
MIRSFLPARPRNRCKHVPDSRRGSIGQRLMRDLTVRQKNRSCRRISSCSMHPCPTSRGWLPPWCKLVMQSHAVSAIGGLRLRATTSWSHMVRTTRCPTCSTISPHRIAAGSALIGIAAACTTSSQSRAHGSSLFSDAELVAAARPSMP